VKSIPQYDGTGIIAAAGPSVLTTSPSASAFWTRAVGINGIDLLQNQNVGIWSDADQAWYLFSFNENNYMGVTRPFPVRYAGRNIEFMPMRIDSVMDVTNNIPYEYTYLSEFMNIDYRWNPFNYAIETHPWGLELIFRNNTPKNLVIPVPLRIENDVIIGQPKFKLYVIDALATRLAVNYQVSTVESMAVAEERSYNMLKKNVSQPIRPVNRRLQQRDILRQGQSKYWRFDGYI
jgi:hypothetical protein